MQGKSAKLFKMNSRVLVLMKLEAFIRSALITIRLILQSLQMKQRHGKEVLAVYLHILEIDHSNFQLKPTKH